MTEDDFYFLLAVAEYGWRQGWLIYMWKPWLDRQGVEFI